MTKLAVITINHGHGEMIRKTIATLHEQVAREPFTAFVVNNVPDNATKTWLADAYPEVRVVENSHPLGFASNINRVITLNPSFDFYLLLNPDVVCLPGMIAGLMGVMAEDEEIGVAGPELLNFDGSVQPSRRRFASFRVLVYRALHIDALFKGLPAVDHYLMTGDNFEGITAVDWVTGAVMLLRKKALDKVGLMDERFFLYFEDEDLCCRMWQQGWKVCYVRSAQAYHAHLAEGRKKVFSRANIQHLLSAFKMLVKYRGKISACKERSTRR
jgi:GT2 family glycosyltransferase